MSFDSGQSNYIEGGRIVIDTGWTKLYQDYWSGAGQSRYVVNASVWLVDIEKRFGTKMDLYSK